MSSVSDYTLGFGKRLSEVFKWHKGDELRNVYASNYLTGHAGKILSQVDIEELITKTENDDSVI